MIEIQIHNEELDEVFQNITTKIQHSEDTGEEIENIYYTFVPHNLHDTIDYSIHYKQESIPIQNFNEFGQYNNKRLPIIDILYGIKNNNNFPIKIQFGYWNIFSNTYHTFNSEYSDTIVYPNEISYIFYGFPYNKLYEIYSYGNYSIQLCDNIIENGNEHIHISFIGCHLKSNFRRFLTQNNTKMTNTKMTNITNDSIIKFSFVNGMIINESNESNEFIDDKPYYNMKSHVFSQTNYVLK